MVVIQSNYISHLSQYSKLQEIISKSQYAIPGFSKAGIKEIVEKNFLGQGISFSQESFKNISNTLTDDPTLLPNMQFLFKQIINEKIEHSKSESFQISAQDIDSFGGIKNCIKFAFEKTLNSLSADQKKHFEKINKALYNFENLNDGKYEQIQVISTLTGLSLKQISEVIFLFKGIVGDSFEIVPRTITGVSKMTLTH